MKWTIALTLAGSAAIAPAAVNTNEGISNVAPAVTQEVLSMDITSNNVISDIAISPYVLLNEWDSLSVEQQAEWRVVYDNLVKEAEIARLKAIRDARIEKLNNVLDAVKSYVGKTPYVFSGASPRAWDCSGLVLWTYAQLGIELPHSASAQLSAGKHVNDPRPGDIVVWGGGYHSGIYIGDGKVVNALNPRVDTSIVGVHELGGSVTYVRAYDY